METDNDKLYITDDADDASFIPALRDRGFYVIRFWERIPSGGCTYGRVGCDYNDATVVCDGCGSDITLPSEPPFVWFVAFMPDIIGGRHCESGAREYSFFGYAADEALHLSCREKRVLCECFDDIRIELRHSDDCRHNIILAAHIRRMTDYIARFYDRQFITRELRNAEILDRYDAFVEQYLADGKARLYGALSSARCAERLHLSEPYFNDLLRFATGHTCGGSFVLKQLELAKKRLSGTDMPVARIAEELGFPSLCHFNCLFKRLTGVSPTSYRSCC